MMLVRSLSLPDLFLQKSEWQEGLDLIDSLLMPGSASNDVLTRYQRNGLHKLKRTLMRTSMSMTNNHGEGEGELAYHHIPKALRIRPTSFCAGLRSSRSMNNNNNKHHDDKRRDSNVATKLYLLSEFGGIRPSLLLHQSNSSINTSGISTPKLRIPSTIRNSVKVFQLKEQRRRSLENVFQPSYGPMEWYDLDRSKQVQLARLLSWENLQKWDFNVFEVANLCHNQPLLFIGWAILCSPHSQRIMEETIALDHIHTREPRRRSISSISYDGDLDDSFRPRMKTSTTSEMSLKRYLEGNEEEKQMVEDMSLTTATTADSSSSKKKGCMKRNEDKLDTTSTSPAAAAGDGYNNGGYDFIDAFKIVPKRLLDYLRVVESNYKADNPYHNNLHGADVLQTTHSLLENMGAKRLCSGSDSTSSASRKYYMFSLLIGAAIHDVGHPGTNNNFQQNSFSSKALIYNDTSILENYHVSLAFRLLMNNGNNGNEGFIDGGDEKVQDDSDEDEEELNFFSSMENDDFAKCRRLIIQAVLGTDMSFHFKNIDLIQNLSSTKSSAKAKRSSSLSAITNEEEEDDDSCNWVNDDQLVWDFLVFLMHVADIASSAKTSHLADQWMKRVYDEFFQQGDMEKRLGLPISPLCDRTVTSKPQSQIGFINFILQPTFEVMGRHLPKLITDVMPNIENNLQRMQLKLQEQQDNEDENSKKEKELEILPPPPPPASSPPTPFPPPSPVTEAEDQEMKPQRNNKYYYKKKNKGFPRAKRKRKNNNKNSSNNQGNKQEKIKDSKFTTSTTAEKINDNNNGTKKKKKTYRRRGGGKGGKRFFTKSREEGKE